MALQFWLQCRYKNCTSFILHSMFGRINIIFYSYLLSCGKKEIKGEGERYINKSGFPFEIIPTRVTVSSRCNHEMITTCWQAYELREYIVIIEESHLQRQSGARTTRASLRFVPEIRKVATRHSDLDKEHFLLPFFSHDASYVVLFSRVSSLL